MGILWLFLNLSCFVHGYHGYYGYTNACMREFKYGRRRRQYETFAELYDPDTRYYNGRLFFGSAYLRLLPYHVNFQGRRTARSTVSMSRISVIRV